MFTVKIIYASGQSALMECVHVNISNARRNLSLIGPGESGELLELDGSETVYIENSNGKTVDIIRPERAPDVGMTSDQTERNRRAGSGSVNY
ncbi:hypothetical protein [Sphingomonas sp.]|jgi:hypothetical protein|uniref:hypothetical protein n=1 Tax=Sphingomonas sp. TaxID=28214 RepID=UPI003567826C